MCQTTVKPNATQAVGLTNQANFVRQFAYCGCLSLFSALVMGTILNIF